MKMFAILTALTFLMGLSNICVTAASSTGENATSATRQKILDDILNNYDSRLSPNFDRDEPVKDIVQMYILSIDSISESSMDYTMSFYLRQRWNDSRLMYDQALGIDVIELDPKLMDDIWIPDLYIINEKQATFHSVTVPNRMMYIYPNGLVLFSARISGTFSCSMDLHKYPIDKQICNIRLESYGHSAKSLFIRWRDPPVEKAPNLNLPQFEIVKTDSFLCDTAYMGINYTCIGLDFTLKRSPGYFVTQVYIPSILVVILSWVNFWLSIDAVPARITLGLLTVLTMTTQSATASEDLQKVSYIKALDVWLAVCLFFVFAALLEFAYVNVSYRVHQRRAKSISDLPTFIHSEVNMNGKENEKSEDGESTKDSRLKRMFSSKGREKARNIDRVARVVFPLAFIIFNIVYWSLYLIWEPVVDEH